MTIPDGSCADSECGGCCFWVNHRVECFGDLVTALEGLMLMIDFKYPMGKVAVAKARGTPCTTSHTLMPAA